MHSSIFMLSDDDNVTFLSGLKGVIFTQISSMQQTVPFLKECPLGTAQSQCVICSDIQTFIWSAREIEVSTRSRLPEIPIHFVFHVPSMFYTESGQSVEGLLIRQALSANPNHCCSANRSIYHLP